MLTDPGQFDQYLAVMKAEWLTCVPEEFNGRIVETRASRQRASRRRRKIFIFISF